MRLPAPAPLRVPAPAAVVLGAAAVSWRVGFPVVVRAPRRRLLLGGGALAAAASVAAGLVTAVTPSLPDRPGRASPARRPAAARPVAITAAWLASAGPYPIERRPVKGTGLAVDRTRPPAGVGHTTECSFECALRVFGRRHAPNFLVGRDARGKVRIVQLVPLGEAAGTMRNLSGGVQTNRWARAQIELVARSRTRPWAPDPQVLAALAHLLVELRDSAGIPLSRPFPDGFAPGETERRRASGKWGSEPGWFSHAEVPENDHWDMGAFQWRRLLAAAEGASGRRFRDGSRGDGSLRAAGDR